MDTTVTVHEGKRSSYLSITYDFTTNTSKRTWSLSSSLTITIRGYDTFGPWTTIGSYSANLRKDGLERISNSGSSSPATFTLATYSKSGDYDDEGYAAAFDLSWAFNVNSSWGGYSNSPHGSISVQPPRIEPNYRTVTCQLSKEKIDGSYEAAEDVHSITVKYGDSYSWTWSETGFNDVVFSGDNVTSNKVDSRNATRKQYRLDLNGYLDGSDSGWIGGYGTCNITFNDNSASAVNVDDYNIAHRYGTHYTFSNIQEVIGHTYKGLKSGSKPLEGDITETTDVRLSFVTNDFYTKDSGTYKPGNVYVKQNGSWVRVRRDGNNTNGFNSLCYIKTNGSWQRIDG